MPGLGLSVLVANVRGRGLRAGRSGRAPLRPRRELLRADHPPCPRGLRHLVRHDRHGDDLLRQRPGPAPCAFRWRAHSFSLETEVVAVGSVNDADDTENAEEQAQHCDHYEKDHHVADGPQVRLDLDEHGRRYMLCFRMRPALLMTRRVRRADTHGRQCTRGTPDPVFPDVNLTWPEAATRPAVDKTMPASVRETYRPLRCVEAVAEAITGECQSHVGSIQRRGASGARDTAKYRATLGGNENPQAQVRAHFLG